MAAMPTNRHRRRAVDAIDMHVHLEVDGHGHASLPRGPGRGLRQVLQGRGPQPVAGRGSPSTTADWTWPPSSSPSTPGPSSGTAQQQRGDRRGAARNNDVLIPFGIGRPADRRRGDRAGQAAGRRLRRARVQVPPEPAGLRPQPTSSSTRSARRCRNWACRPCSTPGRPASAPGSRGGFGIKLGYSNPILLDAVAADFPELRSSWPTPRCRGRTRPSRSPPTRPTCSSTCPAGPRSTSRRQLVRQANSVLQDKVLFGTDFPLITPDNGWRDFADLPTRRTRSGPRSSRTTPSACSGSVAEVPVETAPQTTAQERLYSVLRLLRRRVPPHRRGAESAGAAAGVPGHPGPPAPGRLLGARRVPGPARPAADRSGPHGTGRD